MRALTNLKHALAGYRHRSASDLENGWLVSPEMAEAHDRLQQACEEARGAIERSNGIDSDTYDQLVDLIAEAEAELQ